MDELKFEWDQKKSNSNQRKHGVSFQEAASAFADEFGRLIPDPDHSEDEDRFTPIGISPGLRLLIVCHCYWEGETIRIISSRKANRLERTQYEEYRNAQEL